MSVIQMITISLCVIAVQSARFTGKNTSNDCKTLVFNHTISVPDCQPRVIQNRFCYGQCKSYFLPNRKNYGISSFACSVCRPTVIKKRKVYLKCHAVNGVRRFKVRNIAYIRSCSCVKTKCIPWYSPFKNA